MNSTRYNEANLNDESDQVLPVASSNRFFNKKRLLLSGVVVVLAAVIVVIVVATTTTVFQRSASESSAIDRSDTIASEPIVSLAPSSSFIDVTISPISVAAPPTPVPTEQPQQDDSSEPPASPTPSPTDKQQPLSSAPPTSTPTMTNAPSQREVSCDRYYDCLGDRLSNTVPIYPGQAVCSKGGSDHRFMIGLTPDEGIFHWRDCATNETLVYYNGTGTDLYFMMTDDATWNVFRTVANGNDVVEWKEEALDTTIQNHPQCLSSPVVDCPYLHLRKSGVIVLNAIPQTGGWSAENIRRAYPNLDTPTK